MLSKGAYRPYSLMRLRVNQLEHGSTPTMAHDEGQSSKRFDTRLDFLPRNLRESLLPFQREGIQYALQRNGRCLFGDEMGLGKTIQAISVAYYYKCQWPLLIVVPSSMRYPWIEELEKWLPDLQPNDVNLITSGTDIRNIPRCKISIVGYGLLRNESRTLVQALTDQSFQVVIVDESHYMKNRKAARTKLLVPLLHQARRVILLTGTPALARPAELYTQIDSIQKGLMGSWSQFAKRYCNAHWKQFGRQRMWDTSGASHLDELHKQLVQTVMIRREKNQVLTQLPPKRRQKVPFELADSQEKKELDKCWIQLDKVINPPNEQEDELQNAGFEVKRLATHMYTLTGKAKIGAVCEYVKMLLENQGLKFLVFAHHKEVLTALAQTVAAYAKEHKMQLKYIRIDGDVPSSERMHLVNQFQTDSTTRVALLSILAAGTGLTLTAASQVVFAELHWTPGILEQCEDRAHRIGQVNAIHVHYLVARGTIDEWLWSALSRKVNVLSSTLNGRVQHLRMDEKGGDEVEFLKHAAAWLPSNRDLQDDESFYFGSKKSTQDIRSFFTPSQNEGIKKRKRTSLTSTRPADISSCPQSDTQDQTVETISINDDNDADFQRVKKQRPASNLSRRELFSREVQSMEVKGCLPVNSPTGPDIATTHCASSACMSSSDTGLMAQHEFIDDLPQMKSIKKRQRHGIRGKMGIVEVQPGKFDKCDTKVGDQCKDDRSATAHGVLSCHNNPSTPHWRSSLLQKDSPHTPKPSSCQQEEYSLRKEEKAMPNSPSAAEAKPDGRWSCHACTFDNHADLPFCEICSTPRKMTRSQASKRDKIRHSKAVSETCTDHSSISCFHKTDSETTSMSQMTYSVLSTFGGKIAPEDGSHGDPCRSSLIVADGTCSSAPENGMMKKTTQATGESDSLSYKQPRKPSGVDVSLSCGPVTIINECSSDDEDIVTKHSKQKQQVSKPKYARSSVNYTKDFPHAEGGTPVSTQDLGQGTDKSSASCLTLMSNLSSILQEQWRCLDANCGYLNKANDSECEVCWSPRLKQPSDSYSKVMAKTFIKASLIHQSNRSNKTSPDPVQRLGKDEIDETGSSSSQTETEEEPVLYESFLYCLSKYTDRIYLYDQDGTALNCSFSAIDLQHRDLDALPQVLHSHHNVRIALRFLRQWNSLNEVKRKQLRKTGDLFDDPLAALEALRQGQHYQPCTKRYLTKDDLAEAALQKAEAVGGSVRVISKARLSTVAARPSTVAAWRRSGHQVQAQDKSLSFSGNEEQLFSQSRTPPSKPHTVTVAAEHTKDRSKKTAQLQISSGKHSSSGTGQSDARNRNIAASSVGAKSSATGLKPTPCLDVTAGSLVVERGAYVQAVDGEGRPLCVFCGKVTAMSIAVETHQAAAWDRRYCSETCKDEHSVRLRSSKYVRQQLLDAEHGVCQLCGLQAQQLFNQIKDAAKSERKKLLEQSVFSKMSAQRLNEIIRNPVSGQFWHADHIVAVAEGGGLCSLDNYRTLCVLCHDKVTAEQNARRRRRQRAAGIPDIRAFFKP